MPNVLILSGPNHGFDRSAPIIDAFLQRAGIATTLTDDKGILAAPELAQFDVVIVGTGFTRPERQPDGSRRFVSELTDSQAEGLFSFVRGGKGFLGLHGTGWWIGGEAVRLVGGHANWHPPGLEFTVHIEDPAHPITQGIADFTVQDEI